MTLPSADKLERIPAARWQQLGENLRRNGVPAEYDRVMAVGERSFVHAATPLRRWHAQQSDGFAGRAVLFFVLGESLDEHAAAALLAPLSLDEALDAGFVIRTPDGGVRCPFVLFHVDGALLFADDLRHRGEAVMGIGPWTTRLLAAALPEKRVRRALDLGTGSGFLALSLASHAEEVVASDINPRALLLCAVNAALARTSNVRTTVGSLFEPVGEELFDLIVSQPPFIEQAPEEAKATYKHGGARGDELLLRIVRDVPARLTLGGRAVIIAQGLVLGDSTPLSRIEEALPTDGVHVVAFDAAGADLDDSCIGDAAYDFPSLDDDFATVAIARRAHLARMGVREKRHLLLVIERVEKGRSIRRVPLPTRLANVTPQDVSDEIELGRLMAAGDNELLAQRYRMRSGLAFAATSEADGMIRVVPPPGSRYEEQQLDRTSVELLRLVDSSQTLKPVLAHLSKKMAGAAASEIRERLAAWLLQILDVGLLCVDKR
jgi:SAM-dependent methyltransferase